jgi:hypothetical protein
MVEERKHEIVKIENLRKQKNIEEGDETDK